MLLTIRIWCWRARPALLALAAAVVVLVAARIVAPPAPHTVRVVVLAQDVAAGTSLAATDLRTVAVPPGQVPHGPSAEPGDWVGRSTVVALPAGLTVVPGLLAGSRF
ncbi:MAG TPA: SAF domain-containing protein, partial [Actinotalea sp.]|nr:SAF domain-containing protein [Actinotalea sp.]